MKMPVIQCRLIVRAIIQIGIGMCAVIIIFIELTVPAS